MRAAVRGSDQAGGCKGPAALRPEQFRQHPALALRRILSGHDIGQVTVAGQPIRNGAQPIGQFDVRPRLFDRVKA